MIAPFVNAAWTSYKPNEKQALFHSVLPWNEQLIKGAIGGLGGGKSYACEQEQVLICTKTPFGTSVAARKTVTRAEISLIDDYRKILSGIAKWKSQGKHFLFDNGHRLYILPADEWDYVGSSQLVTFYLQEAQEIKFNVFDALTQRLRSPQGIQNGIPYFRGYLDARGVRKSHWLWKKFASKAWNVTSPLDTRERIENPDYVYVPFKTWDNINNLRPGYVEQLIRDHQGDVMWQNMMIEGEFGFDINGRPVYEAFRPKIHVADEIVEDRSLPMLRGWDFGYNQPAVVFCQYTRSGRLLVLGEVVPQGVSREELGDAVDGFQKERFPGRHPTQYRDFGDIAGTHENTVAESDIEYFEERFQTTIESRTARIKDGLEVVRSLMLRLDKKGDPRFQVDQRCERLVEALSGAYYYKEDTTDERPVKGEGYDDVADALRYVAQGIVEDGFSGNFSRASEGRRSGLSESFASY